MKKLLNINILAMLILSLSGGVFSISQAEAAPSLKQPSTQTILGEKRCEKCKRNDQTGQMECEEVPCPE